MSICDPSTLVPNVAELQDATKMVRGMIKHGMRSGLAREEQDFFVVLDQDEGAWKKATDFADAFRDALPEIDRRGRNLRSRLAGITGRLVVEHARQEQQYRELVARSAQEKQRAAERATLLQQHLTMTKARLAPPVPSALGPSAADRISCSAAANGGPGRRKADP